MGARRERPGRFGEPAIALGEKRPPSNGGRSQGAVADHETAYAYFARPVRAELTRADERIHAILAELGRHSILPELSPVYVQPALEHLFRDGGKLLRPLLVLLAARCAGAIPPSRKEAVIRASAAVELIHTASLAHDDMVDGSTERRGSPSLHAAFGNTTAVLVGDLFYARFFRELGALPATSTTLRMRLLDDFLGVTGRMCEGEILEEQMRAEQLTPSLDAYLLITRAKTADLLSACCRAGSLLNDATESFAESLAGYGEALGLLFQIADDLADGDSVYARRDVLAARAERYAAEAQSLLSKAPDNEATDMLRELPRFIEARSKADGQRSTSRAAG